MDNDISRTLGGWNQITLKKQPTLYLDPQFHMVGKKIEGSGFNGLLSNTNQQTPYLYQNSQIDLSSQRNSEKNQSQETSIYFYVL